MLGKISVDKLKEHPKNNHYFTELDGAKYEEVKRSIEVNGIRDPIKCTTAYTVISGHQRLRIAKELGLEEVPVQIVDVDEWEAEYLLIAENVERRGQAEIDPIKKSRIANFLKEYWGVHQGKRSDLVNNSRSAKDVAEAIGETVDNTKRILKLNDLIPELQDLVSKGKLGTTAAEQLAHMTEENQKILLNVLGEEIVEKTTVAKAKEYRHEAEEADKNHEKYAEQLKQLQKLEDENLLLKHQLEQSKVANQSSQQRIKQLEKQPTKVIKETVRVEDTEEINRLESQLKSYEMLLDQVRKEKESLEEQLERAKMTEDEISDLQDSIHALSMRHSDLKQKLDDIGEIQHFISKIDEIRSEGMAPIVYSRAIDRLSEESFVLDDLKETVEAVGRWYNDMNIILNKFHVIEGGIINE